MYWQATELNHNNGETKIGITYMHELTLRN